MVKGEIVGAGSGVEKGDFADDVGETSDEEGKSAGCERGSVVVVEWYFRDELGDEAWIGSCSVDAILREVEGKTRGWERERRGCGEEGMFYGCGVEGGCGCGEEMICESHRRR